VGIASLSIDFEKIHFFSISHSIVENFFVSTPASYPATKIICIDLNEKERSALGMGPEYL